MLDDAYRPRCARPFKQGNRHKTLSLTPETVKSRVKAYLCKTGGGEAGTGRLLPHDWRCHRSRVALAELLLLDLRAICIGRPAHARPAPRRSEPDLVDSMQAEH